MSRPIYAFPDEDDSDLTYLIADWNREDFYEIYLPKFEGETVILEDQNGVEYDLKRRRK